MDKDKKHDLHIQITEERHQKLRTLAYYSGKSKVEIISIALDLLDPRDLGVNDLKI